MTNISFSQVQKSFHKNMILDIPDFPRLLSCHDSTDYPLSTNFSLGRFSKHRALILLRARISSGEFWEFEEII